MCEEQLAEARICGADIALLIVRILSPDTLQRFIQARLFLSYVTLQHLLSMC